MAAQVTYSGYFAQTASPQTITLPYAPPAGTTVITLATAAGATTVIPSGGTGGTWTYGTCAGSPLLTIGANAGLTSTTFTMTGGGATVGPICILFVTGLNSFTLPNGALTSYQTAAVSQDINGNFVGGFNYSNNNAYLFAGATAPNVATNVAGSYVISGGLVSLGSQTLDPSNRPITYDLLQGQGYNGTAQVFFNSPTWNVAAPAYTTRGTVIALPLSSPPPVNPNPNITDDVFLVDANGVPRAQSGLYVQLTNNLTGATAIANGPTVNGQYSMSRPAAGNYSVATGTSLSGPFTDTGIDTDVPLIDADMVNVDPSAAHLANTETFTGIKTFNAAVMFKGLPWYDVTAYGADPTGVADSQPGIKAATAACPTTGCVLYFPRGTYKIGTYLYGNGSPQTNTTVLGYGATIQAASGTTWSGYNQSMMAISSGVQVVGLTFDGNYSNVTAGAAYSCLAISVGNSNFSFRDCTFQNAWQYGLGIASGSSNVEVTGCTFSAVGNSNVSPGAFSILNGTNTNINFHDNTVLNTGIAAAVTGGVAVGGGNEGNSVLSNARYVNNFVKGYNFIGIGVGANHDNVQVIGNYSDNTGTSIASGKTAGNIDAGTGTNLTIMGNTCYSYAVTGGGGIANGPPSYTATISNNTLFNCGVYLGGAGSGGGVGKQSNFTFTGNVIQNSPGFGLSLPYAYNAVINSNIFLNCGQTASLAETQRGGILLYSSSAASGSQDMKNVRVSDNQIIVDQPSFPTGAGIEIQNDNPGVGVFTNVTIENNDIVGPSTPIQYQFANATQTVPDTTHFLNGRIRNNRGYNPVGLLSTQPTVPASGTASAALSFDCLVGILAGASTVTVAVGGQATGVTIAASGSELFNVPAGQTITLGYTTAPTWKWIAE